MAMTSLADSIDAVVSSRKVLGLGPEKQSELSKCKTNVDERMF